MAYNFDEIVNRRNTESYKWDIKENELPMWVADMDFKAAPEIMEALSNKLNQGVFGYAIVPDEWYDAYISWWQRRHGYIMKKEWLMFCTGVIPAISSTVRKLTTPAEKVVIQTPVYNNFFNSVINNGRFVLENKLIYKDGKYEMDFCDLEKKLSDPQTTLMILCNPHNPVGKIWSKEELLKVGELCKKYHVNVLSDEIHCDITDPGKSYIPFASVSDTCREISVTAIAPTKTFNIAGLQTSAISVPDEALRNRVNRGINTDEVAEPNSFAVDAAIAAFEKGEKWLDELRDYIYNNKMIVKQYFKENLKDITLIESEATYLLWLDCSKTGMDSTRLAADIRRKTGLILSPGGIYGGDGDSFLRFNIASPRGMLEDGLKRLGQYFNK
ncbi:MAG: pyridoxal phosphate-dependent aminotransferase [Lachnospiraceae bacterium]|nr:pyridoxal phosphate-dependent aminotransferase [Lachnospiraceae bacterium]